jgi:hypothetical protein
MRKTILIAFAVVATLLALATCDAWETFENQRVPAREMSEARSDTLMEFVEITTPLSRDMFIRSCEDRGWRHQEVPSAGLDQCQVPQSTERVERNQETDEVVWPVGFYTTVIYYVRDAAAPGCALKETRGSTTTFHEYTCDVSGD